MRVVAIALALAGLVGAVRAQEVPAGALSRADLEEMLAPIALYSDPLLANVLAASVYPEEITAAQAFVKAGGKGDAIDAQNWEPPVKAIAHIPEALNLLADNID